METNNNMKNLFSDSFALQCKTETDFMKAVHEMEKATSWIAGQETNSIKVVPVSGPIEAEQVSKRTNTSMEAAYETCDGEAGTQLLIEYGEKEYLIRTCAIRSLRESAKISGSALNRLGNYKLSEVLNLCFSVAKGSSLLLKRADKVSAVLSDNMGGYKIMPMPELLNVTRSRLEGDFGVPVYESGFVDHEITTVTWALPDRQSQIMDAYQKSIDLSQRRIYAAKFMPAVTFTSSDIGNCAATLYPHFITDTGGTFTLFNPIRVFHKRGAQEGVELFRQRSEELFSVFMTMNKNLKELSSLIIENPQNAFIGLCKKVEIPKKFGSPALEEFMQLIDDGSGAGRCTALDQNIAIGESVAAAKLLGCVGHQVSTLIENTSKILHQNIEDFDVAGVVAWSD